MTATIPRDRLGTATTKQCSKCFAIQSPPVYARQLAVVVQELCKSPSHRIPRTLETKDVKMTTEARLRIAMRSILSATDHLQKRKAKRPNCMTQNVYRVEGVGDIVGLTALHGHFWDRGYRHTMGTMSTQLKRHGEIDGVKVEIVGTKAVTARFTQPIEIPADAEQVNRN